MNMNNDTAAAWFYQYQLKRKRSMLEADQQRVQRLLNRMVHTEDVRRLQRELEHIEARLRKVERGLLY